MAKADEDLHRPGRNVLTKNCLLESSDCVRTIITIIIIIIIIITLIIIIIFYRKLHAVYITIDGCHYV